MRRFVVRESKNWHFPLWFLRILSLGMVMVVLEALELALLAMAGWDNEGSDARRESSYSDD